MKIVDIKCPYSGMEDKNDLENLNRLTQNDELKFVIGSEENYLFAKTILDSNGHRPLTTNKVSLSPVFEIMNPRLLGEWILRDRLEIRLNLQFHKFIWDPDQ